MHTLLGRKLKQKEPRVASNESLDEINIGKWTRSFQGNP